CGARGDDHASRITHHISLPAVASPQQKAYHLADFKTTRRRREQGTRHAQSLDAQRISPSDAATALVCLRSGKAMPFDNEFTLGIEEEFQIIDPVTRELRSRVNEMLEEGRMLLGEQIKPEMHQS